VKRLRHIGHLFQRFHTDRSGLTEKGLPDLFPAGQRARVRRHGPCSRFRKAAFVNDDRLEAVDFLHLLEQKPAVLHALEIHGDDSGFPVAGQIIQKIRAVERQGVAVADGLGKADVVNIRQVIGKILGVAAALADQGNGAGFCGSVLPGQHPVFGNVEAHAIRPDDAQAPFRGDGFNLLLQPDALFFAGFLEAGAEDMDIFVPRGGAFPEYVRDTRGGNGDDDQVRNFRKRRQIRIGPDPVDVLKPGVDGVKPSPVAEISHAAEHPRKSVRFRTGGADHGNGFGVRHLVERGADFRLPFLLPLAACRRARSRGGFIQNHQRVHGHDVSLRGRDQRIDIHLPDIRPLQAKPREAQQNIGQSLGINGRFAAKIPEQLPG